MRKLAAGIMTAIATLVLSGCASPSYKGPVHGSNVEYDSAALQMRNADQMNAIVMKKIKKARAFQKNQEVDDDRGLSAEPAAIAQLQDATRIVFARPDQDGTREATFTILRRELTDLNALDQVLRDLTKEALDALKSDSKNSAREQGTYIVLLDNLMAEIKPEVPSNPAFKQILETIRDAKIEIPAKVMAQQFLRSMAQPTSPSETAAKIVPKK